MVTVEIKGINELMQRLDPRKVQSAARAALERTKTSAKAEAVRQIRQVWNIKKKDLEQKASGAERIKVSGRVGEDLTATLTFYSGGISLAYFGAREFKISARARKAMAAKRGQPYRSGQRTAVRVQVMKGKTTTLTQFFGKVKFGKDKSGTHRGVFRRTGKGRLPIIESQSVGVATMVNQPRVMKPLQQFIADTFNKRITHELKQRKVID